METIEILTQTFKSTAALAELKGIAKTIPNQVMLINTINRSKSETIITSTREYLTY